MDLSTARRLIVELGDDDPTFAGVTPAAEAPRITGYTIDGLIGEGAGGRVWLARAAGSGRRVALKVLRRRLGTGPAASRTWRELDVLDSLRSASLPTLLDYGSVDGRMYIATAYVEGERIDRFCARRRLGLGARVELLARLCDAVAELHAHGVIHRDLKPSNVLVTEVGDPVVIDLGIATLLASDVMETLTSEGAPIGTPAFMAPEQARGERASVSTATDVFGLGAIGYTLLTGGTPYDLGELPLYEAVRRIATEAPRSPEAIAPRLPRPLSAVLAKACATTATGRYRGATELRDDFRRWLRKEPVEAAPPGPWLRLARWVGRRPVASTLILCGALVSGTSLGVWGGVRHYAAEPWSLRTSEDGEAVSLLSRAGLVIRDWVSVDGHPLEVSRVPKGDADWLIAIRGLISPDRSNPALFVFDPHAPATPLMTFPERAAMRFPAVDDGDWAEPATLTTFNATSLAMSAVGDVFASNPGPEIVTYANADRLFACRLVVLDLSGRELASVWSPGHLSGVNIVDDDGLVVFAADCNALRGAVATLRGDGSRRDYHNPPIVAAFRFVMDERPDRWLTYKSPGSTTDLEWCWMLWQPTMASDDDGPRFDATLRSRAASGPETMQRLLIDSWDGGAVSGDMPATVDFLPDGSPPLRTALAQTIADPAVRDALEAIEMIDAPAFDPNVKR